MWELLYSSNRWRHIAAGFRAFEQQAEITLQILRVLVGGLPVYAGGSVLDGNRLRSGRIIRLRVMGAGTDLIIAQGCIPGNLTGPVDRDMRPSWRYAPAHGG